MSGVVTRLLALLGVKGEDGTSIASPDNPFNVKDIPFGDFDTANSRTTPFGAAEDWTGDWVEYGEWPGMLLFVLSDEEIDTVQVQWSNDGISQSSDLFSLTPVTISPPGNGAFYSAVFDFNTPVDKYYRLRVVNGATPATLSVARMWRLRAAYNGTYDILSANPNSFSLALLTKAVIAGDLLDDDNMDSGGFASAFITAQRALTVADLPDQLAIDNSMDSGSLPSGSLPSFDAVGPIVASNVIDTGWVNVSQWDSQQFHAQFDISGVKVFLMNASDDQGNNSVTTSFAFPTATSSGAATSIDIGAPFFQKYFRIVIVNDSGSTATEWSYRSLGLHHTMAPVTLSIDQPIQDFIPAPIHQAINKAQQPDGDWVSSKADGSADSTTTPLSGDGVYQTAWIDSDGWRTVEVFVTSDVTGTVLIEFTDDALVGTVRDSFEREFSAADVADGGRLIRFNTALDGFRVTYTNDATGQTTFLLDVSLREEGSIPQGVLGSDFVLGDNVVGTRGSLLARDSTDDYEEIGRDGDGSSLNTQVTAIDAELPIRPLDSVRVGQGTVTSAAAVPIPSAGTGLTNRKTVEFSNHSNTVNIYFGPTSTVTASTGKILRPGADLAVELNESVDFYWIAEDTGGTTQQSDEDFTVTSGTADTTNNALASDDSRTLFDSAETLTLDTPAYTKTLTDINTLRICVEGRKAPTPATETAAFQEVQVGTTAGATSVASASLAGGSDQLYVAYITRNDTNNISNVAGGGLTWSSEVTNIAAGGRHLDVWYAYGDPTAGAVTASMSTSTRAEISVIRVTGADPTTPIEASGNNTGTGTTATGATIAKTNLGLGIFGVSHEAATATPGAGYTERSDQTGGTGSNTVSLAVETKAFSTTGTEASTMSLGSSTDWAAASIRVLPRNALDITFDVEYDEGSGAVSAGTLTFASTTEETKYIDISGTHSLTEAAINATDVTLTRTDSGAAQGQVDHVFLEVTEGDDDTAARISYAEVADSEYP